MELHNLNDFKGGWIVGDFIPTLIKTNNFEVAIKRYKANDFEPSHLHKISDEITIIVSGTVKMNNIIYQPNDVIFIKKNEFTDFKSLTDSTTCVIKVPSVIGDKHIASLKYDTYIS